MYEQTHKPPKHVKKAVEFIERRKYYYPDKRYPILKQEPLDTLSKRKMKKKKPQNFKSPGTSLKKRNMKWQKVKPTQNIHLPKNAPRNKTSIYDIRKEQDFKEYFQNNFSALKDGVYTSLKGMGRGKGFKHLYLIKLENGKVTQFKSKSNGTPRHNSSSYYSFPHYFRRIKMEKQD